MKALIIVDMQNDFMPGGALGIPKADTLVPTINRLIPHFPLVVASLDWHPLDHISFATNHRGKKVGDRIKIDQLEQVLWPVHCVRDEKGAELITTLDKRAIARVFHKGTDSKIDSYSAFYDNARRKSTGLGEYLKSQKVTDVYLVGVATEYCVLYSAFDAIDLGLCVHVIRDACFPINLTSQDESHAYAMMAAKGIKIVTSQEVLRECDG